MRIALVSEYPPPAAGMTIQAQLLYEGLVKKGVVVEKVVTNSPLNGALSPFRKVVGLRGILRLLVYLCHCLKIARVDVVHIFGQSWLSFYLFSLPAFVLGKLFRKRVILHYHGGAAREFFEKRKSAPKWIKKYADDVVVPSGFLELVFKDYGIETTVIPNILQLDKFPYKQRDTSCRSILVARNLEPVYNTACAIRAFELLSKELEDIELIIAGDGALRPVLEQQVASLELENVRFVGNIPHAEMPALFEQAAILLNTPHYDNLPGSILEAFSSGLAVVSTNVGGIPFIVSDEENGLLVADNDHQAMSEKLKFLLTDRDALIRFTNQASLDVEKYQMEQVIDAWTAFYVVAR